MLGLSSRGVDRLGQLRKASPLKGYSWAVKFPVDRVGLPESADFLSQCVDSISIPQISISPENITIAGHSYSYPAISVPGELTIEFVETSAALVTMLCQLWRQKTFDPQTGLFGLPVDYEFPIEVQLVAGSLAGQSVKEAVINEVTGAGPSIDSKPIISIKIQGCFPSTAGPLDLSYVQSDFVRISQTFSCQMVSYYLDAQAIGTALGVSMDRIISALKSPDLLRHSYQALGHGNIVSLGNNIISSLKQGVRSPFG